MAKKSTAQTQSSSHTGGVDLREVERLLEFMAKHGLEEFEYERAGFRIRLRKPFSQPMGFSRAVSAPEIVVAAGPAVGASHGGGAGAGGGAGQRAERRAVGRLPADLLPAGLNLNRRKADERRRRMFTW